MSKILAIILLKQSELQQFLRKLEPCLIGEKTMRQYVWETPEEINLVVANNVKNLRKRLGITQKQLSERTGVSYASIKRFEETGNINFVSLTKIAVELDAVDGIKSLFTNVPYKSIQEVINEQKSN